VYVNHSLESLKIISEIDEIPLAKKVVSDSLWLVDFAIGLENSVLNLPNRQVKFFEEFNYRIPVNLLIKMLFGLVEMMFGLVNVSFSLPEWQAVKMTLFAPCPMHVGLFFAMCHSWIRSADLELVHLYK